MTSMFRRLLAGLALGFTGGASLAWWLARYEPLTQADYGRLGTSTGAEGGLPMQIDPGRLRSDTVALSSINMRRGGTPGEAQARNWVLNRFGEIGLKRVHLSPVIYPRWRRRARSQLSFFTPAPYEPNFIVITGSPKTAPTGLERPVIDLGGGTETDYAIRSRRGLGDAVHLIRRSDKSREPRGRLIKRAASHGAVAVVFAHQSPSPANMQLIENGSGAALGRIPALAVSYQTGEYLRKKLAKGPVRALLHIKSAYSAGLTANVIGEIPGKRRDYVILAAHYDAWYSGASDNASGLACILELARVWTESRLRPDRTIRFAAFASGGEGMVGSLSEVITRAARVKARCRGIVTPDGVGVPEGALRFNGFPSSLAKTAADLAEEMGYSESTGYPIAVRNSLSYSDHWPYAHLRLPALAIAKGPDPYCHTPYDTAERLDYQDMRWAAAIAGAMALRLAQR
ncbi:MAG: M28 family metallopeptidase [Chloroflexota bacterium]|nr:M28 family metallopeptidase [Chloroflexota bacterium]